MANKLMFLLAALYAVFTLGEFAAILRRQVLQEHVINGVTKGLAKGEAEADPGDPLFLTPYIKKGEYQTARDLSEVKGVSDLHSHAGFFTVNETFNSNMYFWFFLTKNGDMNAPLLLWLQGGPGTSSLFGLFNENGPLMVDESGNVQPRDVNWNEEYSIIYIDNPVGTGFSFTDSEEGYSSNQDQIADNLYECLHQFFLMFDDLQTHDFYIIGESYAGKYIPALAYKIHQTNPLATVKINLKGVAIGEGLCDPINMIGGYANLMWQFGLVDSLQAAYVKKQTDAAVDEINAGNYATAGQIITDLLIGGKYPSYFTNVTGSTNYFNILHSINPKELNYYEAFIDKADVRKEIHVGNLTFSNGSMIHKYLSMDIMKSVAPQLAVVMDNYKVMLYNGQLDVLIAAPLTENFLLQLDWDGAVAYAQADRQVWKINATDTEVAGFVRQVNDFTQVIVRGAGHMVPYDQPERALDMLNRFIGYSSHWEFTD